MHSPHFQSEPDGTLLPLDEGAASPPAWKRTWFIAIVMRLLSRKEKLPSDAAESDEDTSNVDEGSSQSKKQRKAAKKAQKRSKSEDLDDQSSSDIGSSGASTPVNGTTKPAQRGPTVMAGGRRRKAVPRKRPDKKNANADAEQHEDS